MVQRVRKRLKTSSKFITPNFALGQPLLLEGEDATAYDELLGRLCAAVKPVDIIDEILTGDMAQLEWEVLRWRRLKVALMGALQTKTLKFVLDKRLECNPHSKYFVDYLSEILQDNLEEESANAAKVLAAKYVEGKRDAVDKVNEVLAGIERNIDQVMADSWNRTVEELVQGFVRHNPEAVAMIQQLLADLGLTLDALLVNELSERPKCLDHIERIDCLTSSAESRRNACLREIERRRAALGGALRRGVQEIEDAEFQVIDDASSKEKMLRDERAQD
jgi:hypothetical protein